MRINKIKVCGFDKIFDGYKECIKDNRQGFGNDFSSFLSHSMISLDLEDMSTMEIFYLKKIASDVIILSKEYMNFTEKENKIHDKIDALLAIHNSMVGDGDINKTVSEIDDILPCGCVRYRVIAIFKGSNITSITGAMVQSVFGDVSVFQDVYPGNIEVENTIAELFYRRLYTYMAENMTDIDVVTSFITQKKFYQYADNSCNLAHINTPYGELSFFGNSGPVLQKQIADIRDNQQSIPFYLPSKIYLTFVMRTSFNTFMKLFMKNYVTDYENLKFVFIKNDLSIPSEVMHKYGVRVGDCINSLNEYKKELNENTQINLNKFNFIPNGTEIIYSIQVSMEEIDKIVTENILEEEGNNILDDMKSIYEMVKTIIG